MMRVGERLQLRILPVDGTGVLREIIGSDGEEITLLRKIIRDQHRRRRLNHRADLIMPDLHALRLKLRPTLRQDLLCLSQLPDRDNHREHDAHITISRGAEQRAQLLFEKVLPREADADRPVSERGVVLMIELHVIDGLVRADVTGADDDLLRRQRLQNMPVRLKLLLFPRLLPAVEIHEFRAEQTDSAGIVLLYGTDVRRPADVGIDLDGSAVDGRVVLALQLLQQRDSGLILLLLLLERAEQILRRIDIDTAVIAIDDGHLSVPVRADLPALYKRRNVHAACQDRRVAVGAALPGHKPEQQRFVETHRLRRREILRHQNGRLRPLQRIRIRTSEKIQHALPDVIDVRAAGLHIRVVHLCKDLRLIVAGGLDCVFRRLALLGDNLPDRVDQIVVIQHHPMHLEHRRRLLAGLRQRLFIQRVLLRNRLLARLFKARRLRPDIIDLPVADHRLRRPVHLDLPDGDPV